MANEDKTIAAGAAEQEGYEAIGQMRSQRPRGPVVTLPGAHRAGGSYTQAGPNTVELTDYMSPVFEVTLNPWLPHPEMMLKNPKPRDFRPQYGEITNYC